MATKLSRAQIRSIFRCDACKFCAAREAKAKVYPLRYSEPEATKRLGKINGIPFGFLQFFRPASLQFVNVVSNHTFLIKPRVFEKIA